MIFKIFQIFKFQDFKILNFKFKNLIFKVRVTYHICYENKFCNKFNIKFNNKHIENVCIVTSFWLDILVSIPPVFGWLEFPLDGVVELVYPYCKQVPES
jgi:hypothetical protein